MLHLPIDSLQPHPDNPNRVSRENMTKLRKHLERTGRYPPIIVRPFASKYQIIDGHHRVELLKQLGYSEAQCVVWEVDDHETRLLLTTLNRLQGSDDPAKRASLVEQLIEQGRFTAEDLAGLLPENTGRLAKLRELARPATLHQPKPLPEMGTHLHFFLTVQQRQQVEQTLKHIDAKPQQALLKLIDWWQAHQQQNMHTN